MNADHAAYMHRALELAARGKGWVSPNPCVGCVIVKKGKIVGKGYHRQFGGHHAEVFALRAAGNKANGAVAYLTLEPCSHWGKTPPCAPELVKAGIRKVYIAMVDPNPAVSGKGIRILKKAGIQVKIGLEHRASASLNRTFITYMTKKRPHVVLKMAMTLDGKIAATGGESKWISSDASRRLVHKLRTESDAVLVGANTANRDNPQLTSHGAGRNPIRIILDPNLKTKSNLRVYTDKKAQTMLVTPYGSLKASSLKKKGVKILRANLRFGKIEVKDLLNNLFKMNVSQLLVEGGGETAWNFIESGFVDELYFFIAPKILGGRTAVTPVEGQGFGRIKQAFKLRNMSVSRSGEDILVHAFTSRH